MTFYSGQSNGGTLTVNAGPDLYLTSGQTSALQASAYNPNGYLLNYYWTCTGGTLSGYNVSQPIYTAPYNYGTSQTTYTCTLTATDNYGNSNSDSVLVYVNYNNNINYNGSNYIQTNAATSASSTQATLNGYLVNVGQYNSSFVYFQWGPTTFYGSQTNQQLLNNVGSFSQIVSNFNPNTTYHFRAVLQNSNGISYGQDMTFYSSNYGYYGNGVLTANKKVINLTSGNLNWASSVSANPSDILSFAITLQGNGQDIHNVIVRDILPANLIYKGNLTVNTNSNYGGDITSGVNIGTVYANQPVVVAYQVQVAPSASFVYGTTTLSNNATIASSDGGTQTAIATVVVNKALVYGASTVSTGLTNNFLADSFFLPLLLIILMSWLYFTGRIYEFADWMKSKI
jgi:hypothetical protein